MKEQFFHIIKSIAPSFQQDYISLSFRDIGVDSIELITIRVEIEKYFAIDFSDDIWFNFVSFQDILDHLLAFNIQQPVIKEKSRTVSLSKTFHVNMPQMANSALSENWLFKELGNIHWELLTIGLGVPSSKIVDDFGNRLYATFISIAIIGKALFDYNENEEIEFSASINRYGDNIYQTVVQSNFGMTVELLSSFTKRLNNENTELQKSSPSIHSLITEIQRPNALQEYKLIRKNLIENVTFDSQVFPLVHEIIYETSYKIIPFYEINGVGLLYFAAYPIINDICESRFFTENKGLSWEQRFYTKSRKILYLSNCSQGDTIIYRLKYFKEVASNQINIYSTLHRLSDSKRIAEIFTIKLSV